MVSKTLACEWTSSSLVILVTGIEQFVVQVGVEISSIRLPEPRVFHQLHAIQALSMSQLQRCGGRRGNGMAMTPV